MEAEAEAEAVEVAQKLTDSTSLPSTHLSVIPYVTDKVRNHVTSKRLILLYETIKIGKQTKNGVKIFLNKLLSLENKFC